MKRRLTFLLVGTAAILSLVSCGSKEDTSVRPIKIEESATAAIETTVSSAATNSSTEQTTFHERHDYEDGVLVGRWEGEEAEIVLQDNGKVTAEFDISEVMMIEKEGVFMLSGEEYPNVQYDGKTLTILTNGDDDTDPIEFLTLSRKDEPNTESYDGLYDIETELFKEKLAGIIVDEDAADFDIQIRIRYGKFIVCLPEFCEYTQNGDEFSITLPYGSEGTLADELSDSTFVLDGDKVTFYTSEGISEQFEKKE
ncbi:MAG: hypothetical protein J6Y71_02905 [Ruminococcus sp.]|nr:hypothetical protein [Ruminococcus sp.]